MPKKLDNKNKKNLMLKVSIKKIKKMTEIKKRSQEVILFYLKLHKLVNLFKKLNQKMVLILILNYLIF